MFENLYPSRCCNANASLGFDCCRTTWSKKDVFVVSDPWETATRKPLTEAPLCLSGLAVWSRTASGPARQTPCGNAETTSKSARPHDLLDFVAVKPSA